MATSSANVVISIVYTLMSEEEEYVIISGDLAGEIGTLIDNLINALEVPSDEYLKNLQQKYEQSLMAQQKE